MTTASNGNRPYVRRRLKPQNIITRARRDFIPQDTITREGRVHTSRYNHRAKKGVPTSDTPTGTKS